MTARDRLVLMGLSVLAVLALGWFVIVSPARKQATEAEAAVQSAKAQVESAHEHAQSAQGAEHAYDSDYATVVSLGLAVPSSSEVPGLMYELEDASNSKGVAFDSISSGDSGAPASSTPATSGFTTLPFTFIFEGTFSGLAGLFDKLDGFALPTSSGVPRVAGRLITIQDLDLAAAGEVKGANTPMTATVTASAYALAGGASVTEGASAAGPSSSAAASSTASSGGSSALSTPAVIGERW